MLIGIFRTTPNMVLIDIDKYCSLASEIKVKLLAISDTIYSAIVYGSFSRCELYSKHSDIDLLCIIKSSILELALAKELNRIVLDCYSKYKIKIHLRVRSLDDLKTGYSGIFDCGFTNSINKLRDGLLICGNSLDGFYLDYIRQSSSIDYYNNLKNRFSDLSYQNRSLLSIVSNYTNMTEYDDFLMYKCGCILFQLAELICYVSGMHFVSSIDAINKANAVYHINLFEKACEIKKGNLKVELPEFVETIEKLIYDNVTHINANNYHLLQNIELIKFPEIKRNNLTIKVLEDIKHKLPLKDIVCFMKVSIIEDGKLYVVYV